MSNGSVECFGVPTETRQKNAQGRRREAIRQLTYEEGEQQHHVTSGDSKGLIKLVKGYRCKKNRWIQGSLGIRYAETQQSGFCGGRGILKQQPNEIAQGRALYCKYLELHM